MSNLIVTIISITLAAAAAVMTIYYVNTAFQTATVQSTANTIINEATQILQAARMWCTDNNQPDISGMGAGGGAGTGMSALINKKYLAEWPALGGGMGTDSTLTHSGPQPVVGNSYPATPSITSLGASDVGYYNISGYSGPFVRFMVAYKNQNYVVYSFNASFMSTATDTSQANHPIIQIAKAINATLNQIPANANKAPMAYTGIPAPPAGSTVSASSYSTYNFTANQFFADSNGAAQTNYCYFSYPYPSVSYGWLACVFGPS